MPRNHASKVWTLDQALRSRPEMTGYVSLTPVEARVVAAVIEHRNFAEAARAISRSPRQVRRVLGRAHVREALARQVDALQLEARQRLRALSGDAVSALGTLLEDPSASIRLKSALGVLGLVETDRQPASLAVAVSSSAMDKAALDALMHVLTFEQKRELRAELLRRAGIERPSFPPPPWRRPPTHDRDPAPDPGGART